MEQKHVKEEVYEERSYPINSVWEIQTVTVGGYHPQWLTSSNYTLPPEVFTAS